jgi:MOSC domain-containing protein YiiM
MAALIGIAKAPQLLEDMQELQEAEITIESGLQGDARGKKRQRQISILFEEDWKDACNDLGTNLSWLTRRANLFINNMRSPRTPGTLVKIGDVKLEVCQETEPCDLMDKQYQGLQEKLVTEWRGGVCCNVRSSGHIKLGDLIEVISTA